MSILVVFTLSLCCFYIFCACTSHFIIQYFPTVLTSPSRPSHTEAPSRQRHQSLKMVDPQYYLPNDIGVSALDCSEAFRLLSPQEKMYAHYMSRAAWYVARKHLCLLTVVNLSF